MRRRVVNIVLTFLQIGLAVMALTLTLWCLTLPFGALSILGVTFGFIGSCGLLVSAGRGWQVTVTRKSFPMCELIFPG